MAMLHYDGLDLYGNAGTNDMQEAGYTILSGTGLFVSNSLGRFSGGAFQCTNTAIGYAFTMSGTTAIAQFAFRNTGVASVGGLFEFMRTSGTVLGMRLQVTPTHQIRLQNASGATVVDSAAQVFTENTYHYLELKVTNIGATATVLVKIDGVTVINQANVNVGGTFDMATWSGASGSQNQFDDIVLMDGSGTELNDLLGDCRIYEDLLPTSDTADADFTLSAGANGYALVDDPAGDHDGDATYIESATLTDLSMFGMGDLPGTVSNVYCVATVTAGKKTDSSPREVSAQIRSSGNIQAGATHALATTYNQWRDYYPLDPNGSIAWTASAVNALEAGVQLDT